MTDITIPTIHLNGSSKQFLIDQWSKTMEMLRLSMDCMRDCTPNGRDYYPQGEGVTEKARDEHADRSRKIQEVHDELMQIAIGVDKQRAAR
jgi:hypothetical protein